MSPSRRFATVLVPVLLLAACGGDDASSTASSEPSPSTAAVTTTAPDPTATTSPDATSTASSAPAADAFPVTITNRLGEATIESRPERIVALGPNDIDVVYALGLTPVGIAANAATGGLAPWLADEYSLDGVEVVTSGTELSFEAIAALDPDVILASPLPTIDQVYDQLASIAPVVADTSGVLTDSWQERTRKLGVALGASDEVEALIAGAEADLDDVAARHPHLDGQTYTLSWARAIDQIAVMAADDVTSQMFNRLGLTIPQAVLDMQTVASGAGTGGASVSLETIDQLDADLMIVAYNNDSERETFESSPVFQAVPAVADGRYLAIDLGTVSALRAPTVLSIGWAFAQLEPLFETVAP